MPKLGLGSNLTSGSVVSGEADTTSFISTWTVSGDEAARTVTLPLHDSAPHLTLDFTIDWGDETAQETITAHDDADRVHIYAENGTYEVTMSSVSHSGTTGRVGNFNFNNGAGVGGDKAKLVGISQWGSYCQRIDDAFYGCSNLVITAEDAPDLTPLTGQADGLAHFFDGCTELESIGSAADWDVCNVENLGYMFKLCPKFNQDITMWDTSSCISFQSMFQSATIFNQAIGSWDTSVAGATGFGGMFYYASDFNQNLNSWDWSNNEDCWNMFHYAIAFQNGVGGVGHLDGNAPNWNMTKTQYFVDMFMYSNFNQDLSGCTGIGTATGAVAWFKRMFAYNTSFDQDIGHFVVSNVKDSTSWGMANMFQGGSSGLSAANYNKTLVAWALQDATDDVNFGGDQSDADATSGSADGDTARASLVSVDSWVITDADT